ncbi:transcriptional activator RinB [Staphylococcus epidermidis]
MIKRILKDLFIIAMYELGKYLTSLLITILESEDDIDTAPNDFALETDQIDLNKIKAEVSE